MNTKPVTVADTDSRIRDVYPLDNGTSARSFETPKMLAEFANDIYAILQIVYNIIVN